VKADGKIPQSGQSGYKNGYLKNKNQQPLVPQGFAGFSLQKYGLKAARRAPQFSKR